jgi:SAM-dependent methyltransferase
VSDREAGVRAQYERWLRGRSPVALYVRWYLRHGGARYARDLFDALSPSRFERVLDVGCATGFYLKWAFDHGYGSKVLAGVDLSSVMLEEASARLTSALRAGVDVLLVEGSATTLPFSDSSFDTLVCSGVVKYLDDAMLDRFLQEALRVLEPGGRIALAEFGRLVPLQAAITPPERFGVPTDHLRTDRELCEVLSANGFTGVGALSLSRLRRLPFTYEGAVGTRE